MACFSGEGLCFNRCAMGRMVTMFVLFTSLVAVGQQSALDQANAAMSASDYATAAKLYQQVTTKEPTNGAAWEGLGDASLKSGRFEDADKAYAKAVELKWRPYLNRVNLARVAAKQGHKEDALRILKEVAASGKASGLRGFLAMPEFASLKGSAEFEKVKEGFLPCRTAEYRQFDFWVGQWDVQTPGGQPLGVNHVTLEQDGCLLVEHWASGRGVETGSSFNYYDTRDKKWHQLYIANNGNAGAFPAMAGELKDDRMVLMSDMTDGTQYRWTWYVIEPGKVRQMAEQTTDGGKTWSTAWDSVYVKKATGGVVAESHWL